MSTYDNSEAEIKESISALDEPATGETELFAYTYPFLKDKLLLGVRDNHYSLEESIWLTRDDALKLINILYNFVDKQPLDFEILPVDRIGYMWFFWEFEDQWQIWWSYTNRDQELDYQAEREDQRYGN